MRWKISNEKPTTEQGARFWITGPAPPPSIVVAAQPEPAEERWLSRGQLEERLAQAIAERDRFEEAARTWHDRADKLAEALREIEQLTNGGQVIRISEVARAALSEPDELTSMDIDDEGNLLSTPDE